MRYISNTEEDLNSMLKEIGAGSVSELFRDIPAQYILEEGLPLPGPLSELELLNRMEEMSGSNASMQDYASFLGGGVYHHFIPSVVHHLAGRSEFYTSYTPYQPEISQGTLQAIFEYQTLMCMLLSMDVSNASMYDGASSLAEAVLMALRRAKGNRVLLSQTVHPEYREVVHTYCAPQEIEITEIPHTMDGVTDIDKLSEAFDEKTACVVIQSPNFFGIIEEMERYESIVHQTDSLFIVNFTEPLSFGILKPPGVAGADIACGEGQSFGIPPGFGGPHLGIFTTKAELLRNLPGRIAGKSVDTRGRKAFVLTLTAREQHIRREKSTSNICTNQGLCALTTTVYLSALGKQGIRKLSSMNHKRAEYAKKQLLGVSGVELRFQAPTFNEFVVRTDRNPHEIVEALLHKKIYAGIPLKRFYSELSDCLLITVTEMNSQEQIDNLCTALRAL